MGDVEREARRGRADQPACGCSRAVAAPARRRDRDRRLGLVGVLVRPPHAAAPRHARLAVGHAGLDGRGGAVRDRREVRPPGPPGDRAGGRRLDADERHGRADDGPAVLAGLADPRLVVAVLQQRPQPGHLGAAGCRAPRFAPSQDLPEVDYAALARAMGLDGINVEPPVLCPGPGPRRWPRTGPRSWMSGWTPTYPRSRPMPPWTRQ